MRFISTCRKLAFIIFVAAAHDIFPVTADCPPGRSQTEKCVVPPEGWKNFKKFIEESSGRLILCPFSISMMQDDKPLILKKNHDIICATKRRCVIKGGGVQVMVWSSKANISLSGFILKDATKKSIFVSSYASNYEHSLCYTKFDSNESNRGPAVTAREGTKLNIFKSNFVNNSAAFGAVYSAGKVVITDSFFHGNTATNDGSAIYLTTPNSTITIKGTTFKNNKGGKSFVSAVASFIDDGGNNGSGNTCTCGENRVYMKESEECVSFAGKYPAHPVPKNPPNGYFNYDINDMRYGPEAWGNIPAKETYAYQYWKDLSIYFPSDMTKNTCDSKKHFNNNKASPINLRNTDDNCKEFHQMRPNKKTRPMPILGPLNRCAELNILPYSLQVEYPRVSNDDLTVPSIDIPMGWGKFLHAAYCELKVPASHTMQGEEFSAELNCPIIQKAGRGLGIVTILFELGKYNSHLQHFIDCFDIVWKDHKNKCKEEGQRYLTKDNNSNNIVRDIAVYVDATNSTIAVDKRRAEIIEDGKILLGPKNTSRYWDKPWDPFKFIEQTGSFWFYGYKGTLMEPPCSQIAEYRVLDTPAQMSESQLDDIKRILFTHQNPDSNCSYTSVHNNEESVARPLQPSRRARVHRCTCRDFLSDQQRKRYGNRYCLKGAESLWMPNSEDLKPAPGQQWDQD